MFLKVGKSGGDSGSNAFDFNSNRIITRPRKRLEFTDRTKNTSLYIPHFLTLLSCHVYQISYGRFTTKQTRKCEMDLFIMQADGKKIVDPNKQDALCSRIRRDLVRSLRVSLVSRGPDTELLVANPVELSGMGRPLVFHDITLALKILNTGIFSVLPYLRAIVNGIYSSVFSAFSRVFLYTVLE